MSHPTLKKFLLAGAALTIVSACSDANISSPGEGQLVTPPTPAPVPPAPTPTAGASFVPTSGCPAGTASITLGSGAASNTVCEVAVDANGVITADLTLIGDSSVAGGVVYYFDQPTFVGTDDGPTGGLGTSVTVTVQAGVNLVFANPTDFFTVNRGSEILANGVAAAPIVFTSNEDMFDDGLANNSQGSARGQWGGLILNGQAPINSCADPTMPATCETSGEGGTGNYGGPNANDSSGVLNYVRVQYAGFEVTTDNELNGIAFQGVGDGTVVDFIQVHNNDDDGIEFFGGTVDVKHVVITGVDDDALDWVAGWNGSAQFVLIAGSGVGDNGFEGDNNSSNNNQSPRSAPTIANWTSIGGATEDLGMQIREGTAGMFVNGVVTGWEDGCLDVDDQATFDQITAGNLDIDATFFGCAIPYDDLGNDPIDITTAFPGIVEGTTSGAAPELTLSVSVTPISGGALTALDPALDGSVIAIGLDGQNDDWYLGWTVPGSF